MPSPVAHTLAGLTVHLVTSRDREDARDLGRAGLVVGAALAPDLDLLFRFVDGRNHHNNETHSLGFALLAALAVFAAARLRGVKRSWALGGAAGLGWLSHVVLDYLNRDTHPPIGLMALWPFSHAHHKFPWPVFLDIGRTLEWDTVRNNTVAVAWETVVLLPLLMVVWRRSFGRGSDRWHEGSRASR
jgi:hypothetical protein